MNTYKIIFTREGLDWLGEKLRIQIHDPRD